MDDEASEQFELPADWKIPKAWADWAMQERAWKITAVKRSAKKFHEYHRLKHTTRATVDEWELAFRSWIRNERDEVKEAEGKQHQGPLCGREGCDQLGTVCANQGGGPWYCWGHCSFNSLKEATCFL